MLVRKRIATLSALTVAALCGISACNAVLGIRVLPAGAPEDGGADSAVGVDGGQTAFDATSGVDSPADVASDDAPPSSVDVISEGTNSVAAPGLDAPTDSQLPESGPPEGDACISPAQRCTGDAGTVLQACGTDGTWQAGTVTRAVCGAVCTPTSTLCDAGVPATCGSNGLWQTDEVTVGQCGAVCSPGATQCVGNGIETCGDNGQWNTATPCPSATPSCIGGHCIVPPSCTASGPGLSNCGPTVETCCTSVEVLGGTFYRSYDGVDFVDMTSPASVSGFRLDKYEVTVARYRQFVAASVGGWVPPSASGKHTHLNGGRGLTDSSASGPYETGWMSAWNANLAATQAAWNSNLTTAGSDCTWTPTSGHDNLPINCLNWYELYAFCIWDGGFLPSEAEWNYTASGGGGANGQRVYPWSNPSTSTSIDCFLADYMSCNGGGNPSYPSSVGGESPGGDGNWGQADLAGSVSEWNLDWYADYVTPCVDCAYLSPGSMSQRMSRGGGFYDSASDLLTGSRIYFPADPTERGDFRGGRCARAP
jgi:formylglycine-generating enzyme required for sulfatase activity